MNKLLKTYINKRLNEPTVILCFKIILQNALKNGKSSIMTKSEIEKIFNVENKIFGVQTFRRDYVMRQSGNAENAIDEINERFFIRAEYMEGSSDDELYDLIDSITNFYKEKNAARNEYFHEIESYLDKEVDSVFNFILELLLVRETDRRGQNFEVVSYAILKTFYEIRGFELNRFSTIYANDGGVDYSSQNSIYQVTTQLNEKKFYEDIKKAPMKKRIMVYRELSKNFDMELFKHEWILDYIGPEELQGHLEYMRHKNAENNMKQIVTTILNEFIREFYM